MFKFLIIVIENYQTMKVNYSKWIKAGKKGDTVKKLVLSIEKSKVVAFLNNTAGI
jgi:hypothetical protein